MLKRILKVNVTWPGDSRCTHPSVWWFIFTWLLTGIVAAHPMSSVDACWLLSLYTRISSCSWSGHNFLIGINDNMPSSLQLDAQRIDFRLLNVCEFRQLYSAIFTVHMPSDTRYWSHTDIRMHHCSIHAKKLTYLNGIQHWNGYNSNCSYVHTTHDNMQTHQLTAFKLTSNHYYIKVYKNFKISSSFSPM